MNEAADPPPHQTVQLRVGEPLEIPVGPSDARTGYVWTMRELPECVALESTRDVPSPVPAHGRGPSRVFRVVGCCQGAGTLRCVLAPQWDPLDAVDERRYRMIVQHPRADRPCGRPG